MAKNERTSYRVAKIAGRILEVCKGLNGGLPANVLTGLTSGIEITRVCTVAELRALAASCLTQTPDRVRVKK